MKKSVFLIAIFLFFIPLAESQTSGLGLQNFRASYKATYQVSFQPDSTDIKRRESGIMFTLFLSDSHSYYVNVERYMLDSIVNQVGKGNIRPEFVLANLGAMPQPRANFRVFKCRTSKSIITLDIIGHKNYATAEPLSIIKWQIHPITQMIGPLLCQMATGSFAGRDYVAWFTTEIKIAEGPFKFNGLPGLIVKIADTRDHYSFELVDFRSTQEMVRVLPSDPVEWTTKQELRKKSAQFRADPIIYFEAMGAVFDRENRRKVREKISERDRRNNNPIELKFD